MFLFIETDGKVTESHKVTDEDFNRAAKGTVTIIDIGGRMPTQYREGSWYGINKARLAH